MKTMTNNLKYFSGLTLIFSIIFFYYLYSDITIQSYNKIWIYAILYGMTLFISGLILGYKDPVRNSIYDLGFQYHLTTFIIVNCIGFIASLIAMGINLKTLLTSIMPIIFWGLGLLIHYYFSLKSIKGINKKEIFD
ncbi:hypothetical protein D7030_11875 [Flavobacteriaceae bacterium AU392]|nr:hypothetical protein D1817_12795 [Flavobacteriaceae bacterium]RKM82849.1 hypothetical protein D7030_11875 [Flavobacteriaceae bacterium AU392]